MRGGWGRIYRGEGKGSTDLDQVTFLRVISSSVSSSFPSVSANLSFD